MSKNGIYTVQELRCLIAQRGRLFFMRPTTMYSIQAVIALAIFIVGFGPMRFINGWPTGATGDAMHHVMLAKAIIEEGWYWNIPRLSAPYTLPMLMFPVGGLLDTLIFKFFSYLTSNPFTLVTWFFGCTFVLSTLSASYVLNDLGVNRWASAAFALTFAFAPFPFARSVNHLMLVIYLVPFAIGFCVHLICGSFEKLSFRRKAVYLIAAGGLGINYVYTSFFACFFVAVSCMLILLKPSLRATARYGLVYVAIISGGVVFSLGPSILAVKSDPVANIELYGFKSLADADVYGLKIRHLLLPSEDSSISAITKARDKLSTGFPLDNENLSTRLGVIGSIGLITALFAGLIRLAGTEPGSCELCQKISPLSALLFSGILLATIGGFGSVFNAFVSLEIRAYNRITLFLLFICILIAAFTCGHVTRKLSRFWAGSLLVLVTVAGLAEQTDFRKLREQSFISLKQIEEVQPAVEQLEREMTGGAAIYQMPFTNYPHTPPMVSMAANEHLMAYVLSNRLRWSWPALSGPAIELNRKLEKMEPTRLTKALVELGFSAIWINRSGYLDQGSGVIYSLQEAGAKLMRNQSNEKIALLDLRPLRSMLESTLGEAQITAERNKLLNPTVFSIGDVLDFSQNGNSAAVLHSGWFGQEEKFRWTAGKNAEIRFRLAPSDRNIVLRIEANAFLAASRPTETITISINGKKAAEFLCKLGAPIPVIDVPIDPRLVLNGDSINLTISVGDPRSPRELGLSADDRVLGAYVKSILIIPES